MRRQNPPQSYLDKAQNIEKYLRPLTIAAIYGVSGLAYCVLVALIFVGLVYASVVNPTPIVITIFAAVALIPTILLLLAWFLRPDDPVSSHFSRVVDMWRNPIALQPEASTFTIVLADGESVGMKLAFYYPSESHTPSVKSRLYTCVHAALANDFSGHTAAPTRQEIEQAIDPGLETLALEYSIPIFYAEVQDISSDRSDVMPPLQYLKTAAQ
jgi:hypothetical protein